MGEWTRVLAGPEETHAWGLELGKAATPGAVFALSGDLGAGKTSLARGIAEGWGVRAPREVVSPTFALMLDHPSPRGRLVHIDLYRLEGIDSVLGLGIEEAVRDAGALVVIEWADRIPELIPPHAMWIRLIEHGDGRRALVTAQG